MRAKLGVDHSGYPSCLVPEKKGPGHFVNRRDGDGSMSYDEDISIASLTYGTQRSK